MTDDDDLWAAAEDYADELNTLDPAVVPEWLVEVAAGCPYWDSRTNLYSLSAERSEDLGLVLSSPAGGDDRGLVVRWIGRWVVDTDPVNWDALVQRAAAVT